MISKTVTPDSFLVLRVQNRTKGLGKAVYHFISRSLAWKQCEDFFRVSEKVRHDLAGLIRKLLIFYRC